MSQITIAIHFPLSHPKLIYTLKFLPKRFNIRRIASPQPLTAPFLTLGTSTETFQPQPLPPAVPRAPHMRRIPKSFGRVDRAFLRLAILGGTFALKGPL
ncbi:hypothetical protein AVEN_187485-1 [Araneus ventricosus]|uniref:Uncharacterized protein n=1 Tax=Araneus ventricosus TaxID=182803 RepID=A0A4Y2BRY7_ARAVE|nr:hypothetical protein AVEN_187485-1 [Araneus ventricosus]